MTRIPYSQELKRSILENTDIFTPVLRQASFLPADLLVDVGAKQSGYSVEKKGEEIWVSFRYVLDNDGYYNNGALSYDDQFIIDVKTQKWVDFRREFSGNITTPFWAAALSEFKGDRSLNFDRPDVKDFYRKVVLKLPYEDDHDPEAEIGLHRAAVKAYPQNAEAYLNLAKALLFNTEHEAALLECRKAHQLKPNDAEIQEILGLILNLTGDYEESLAYDSSSPSAYFQYGIQLYTQGDTVGALIRLYEALRLAPQDAEILSELSMLLSLGH